MHRLFLAIPLPEDIAKSVATVCRGFNEPCGRARWTAAENMHVTVLFLGNVEDDEHERLMPQLADACRNALPFELTATGIEVSPRPSGRQVPRRPSAMLWLSFRPSIGFAALTLAVREAVRNILDLEPPHGKILPHATLARFGDGIPMTCRKSAESVKYNRTFAVDSCVLFESRLSPDGPVYTELQTFALANS